MRMRACTMLFTAAQMTNWSDHGGAGATLLVFNACCDGWYGKDSCVFVVPGSEPVKGVQQVHARGSQPCR
jgi:hypothetical protein